MLVFMCSRIIIKALTLAFQCKAGFQNYIGKNYSNVAEESVAIHFTLACRVFGEKNKTLSHSIIFSSTIMQHKAITDKQAVNTIFADEIDL